MIACLFVLGLSKDYYNFILTLIYIFISPLWVSTFISSTINNKLLLSPSLTPSKNMIKECNAMMVQLRVQRGKIHTVNQGDFAQWSDFEQFFNISVLSLYEEFLDEMFLIVKFSHQSLWHDYLIVKFFVQRQYKGVGKLSKVAPLFEVAPVDGTSNITQPISNKRNLQVWGFSN